LWKISYLLYEVPLTIVLPEFLSSMEVQWSCAIDKNPNSTYDMILGRDLQSALRMDILFSTGTLVWNEISIDTNVYWTTTTRTEASKQVVLSGSGH
jgi:hypothetical protein